MLLPARGVGAPCTQYRPTATAHIPFDVPKAATRCSSCRAARLDWPGGQSVTSRVAESRRPAFTEEQVAIKRAAKAARLSGQLQEALQILQDGLQQYPQDLHLLALAASTSSKLGHHQLAQQYLDTALQLDSGNVRLLCTQAGAAGRRQQYDTARHLYQRAHDSNRHNPVVLHSWAAMEAAAGDQEAAKELAEAAIAADSRYLQAYVLRGRLDAACGDAAAARGWHQRAMQVQPAYAPNLHAWAQLEVGEGNWAAAEGLLRRALEAQGDHLPSWQLLCRVLWQQGQVDAAADTYQQGLQAVRHHPQLQHYWATLQLHSNQHAAALQLLEQLGAAPTVGATTVGPGGPSGSSSSSSSSGGGGGGGGGNSAYTDTSTGSSSSSRPPDRGRRRRRAAAAAAAVAVHGVAEDMVPVVTSSSNGGPAASAEATSAAAAAAAAAAILAAPSMREPSTRSQQQQQQLRDTPRQLSRRALRPQSPGGTNMAAAVAGTTHDAGNSLGSSRSSSSSSSRSRIGPDSQLSPTPSNGDGGNSSGSANGSSTAAWLPAVVQAAMAYARAGNSDAAMELYNRALAAAPTNPRLLHSWAQFQLAQGDTPGAESALSQLEAVEPGNGYLCYLRGVLAQQQGELGSARGWFSKGLRYAGNEGALLCYEGLSSLEAFTGNLAGATALIATALANRAATPRFLRAASNHYKRTGDMKRALGLAGRAARLAPQDYKNWLQLGVLHRRCKDYAAAAQCFQRGTQVAPGYPPTWYMWAVMTWRNCRDLPAARHLFGQATSACPRNATLWMEWALLEWEEGDLERSRQLFQRGAGVPAARQHPPLYQAWAEREAAAGNLEVAAGLTDTYERLLLRRSRPQGRSGQQLQLSS